MIVAIFTMMVNGYSQSYVQDLTNPVTITFQGGIQNVNKFDSFYMEEYTTVVPVARIGFEKYFTPTFATELAFENISDYNEYFLQVTNVSLSLKYNFAHNSWHNVTRKWFEPVPYIGIGWGHFWPDVDGASFRRDFITYRTGIEFTFNDLKTDKWAFVVRTGIQWYDKIKKISSSFELTGGFVYRI